MIQGYFKKIKAFAVLKGTSYQEMKLDPNKWSSLKETLLLLRFPKYYQEAAYGYCRGTKPIRYVKRIRVYYDILKREGIEYGHG